MTKLKDDMEKAKRRHRLRCFISNLFPKSSLKNLIRQLFYQYMYYDFKVKIKKGYIEIDNYLGNKFTMKFHFDEQLKYPLSKNPLSDLKDGIKGYLKHDNIKKGDVIIDCGSYVGQFTILAAYLVGKEGKVIAFEPDPKNYAQLLKNIELNGLENIHPINKGVWNANAKLEFHQQGNCGSTLCATTDKKKEGKITSVYVVSLDNIIKELKLDTIDFIKMDIEGAELEAIEGGKDMVKRYQPTLAIASYHLREGKQTWKMLEPAFQKLGYKARTEFLGQVTTYAHPSFD